MIATIIMTICLIAAIAAGIMYKKARANKQLTHGSAEQAIPLAVAVASLVAIVITAAFSVIYRQDVGEAKVIRSLSGEVVGKDTTAGFGAKLPWHTAIDFDVRNQVVTYAGDGTNPDINAQDKDGATATVDVVVCYSIDPEYVINIYNQYQSQANFTSRLIQNDVRSVVRNIPLKYSTSSFRLHREQAATEMQQALSERWKDEGIVVDSVDLRDIRYPANIEESLQRVQEATNNANKAKADLETAKVEAEKTRVEAQAQADYDQIVRCGSSVITEKTTINGQETDITKVVPNVGDACQNRLNDQVLMNKYIDALKEMADKGNIVVVPEGFGGILNPPPNSAPLRYRHRIRTCIYRCGLVAFFLPVHDIIQA